MSNKISNLNNIEQWMLLRLIKKVVTQGDHLYNIEQLYKIIYSTTRKEFFEDPDNTIKLLLSELNATAMKND